MGRVLLVVRLALRGLRRRPVQAILLLLAITAATATLTLGLALNGVISNPYQAAKTATSGPDVMATGLPGQLTALAAASGVTASSGPYPVASATMRAGGRALPAQAEGRASASAAVDQPLVTQGTWVRPGGVVLERTFAQAVGARVGEMVTRTAGRSVSRGSPSPRRCRSRLPRRCPTC
jgi:putative ABC transport system permease protein